MPPPDPANPIVISHAACAGHAPENTLRGIRRALDIGADAIEVDVRATADGVPVLMHDDTLDRTTNGAGPLAQRSLQDLRPLDAGGEPVPTLAEALSLVKGRAVLVAELKTHGIEATIAQIMREAGALEQVMVWSFLPPALEAMRAAQPNLLRALLIAPQSADNWPTTRDLANRLGVRGVGVLHRALDERTISDAHDNGLSVFGWTADSEADIRRLIGLEVDGIVTNYPERALALLGQHGGSA